jgi:hypothetical protein
MTLFSRISYDDETRSRSLGRFRILSWVLMIGGFLGLIHQFGLRKGTAVWSAVVFAVLVIIRVGFRRRATSVTKES